MQELSISVEKDVASFFFLIAISLLLSFRTVVAFVQMQERLQQSSIIYFRQEKRIENTL